MELGQPLCNLESCLHLLWPAAQLGLGLNDADHICGCLKAVTQKHIWLG